MIKKIDGTVKRGVGFNDVRIAGLVIKWWKLIG